MCDEAAPQHRPNNGTWGYLKWTAPSLGKDMCEGKIFHALAYHCLGSYALNYALCQSSGSFHRGLLNLFWDKFVNKQLEGSS